MGIKINLKFIIVICCYFLCFSFNYAQNDKNKANQLTMKAIELMDSGQIDESIILLKKAKKLDKGNYLYDYEIALANYKKGKYKNSIKILEKLKKRDDINDFVFQLLGNSYSLTGNKQKAINTYESGLKKFPNSGSLYLERGNIELQKREYDKALYYYEIGIDVAPRFPSNYYWASKILIASGDKTWGLIYGEIFMNLERNSARTVEISKLIYNTYKNNIKINNETISVSLSNQIVSNHININDPLSFRIPFGMLIYEPTLLLSIQEKEINMSSLNNIRTKFIENYYMMEHNKKYPNILFDYNKEIIENGHFEAYNHWILSEGNEEEFDYWKSFNQDKWQDFVDWFIPNPLSLNNEKKIHRSQY